MPEIFNPLDDVVSGALGGFQVGHNAAITNRRQALQEKDQAELADFRRQKLEMEKAAAARENEQHAISMQASKQELTQSAERFSVDQKRNALGLAQEERANSQMLAGQKVNDAAAWESIGAAGDSWRKRAGEDPKLLADAEELFGFARDYVLNNPDGVQQMAEHLGQLEDRFQASVLDKQISDANSQMKTLEKPDLNGFVDPVAYQSMGEALQSPDLGIRAKAVRDIREYTEHVIEAASTEDIRMRSIEHLNVAMQPIDALIASGKATDQDYAIESAISDIKYALNDASLTRKQIQQARSQAFHILHSPPPSKAEADDKAWSRKLAQEKLRVDMMQALGNSPSATKEKLRMAAEANGSASARATPTPEAIKAAVKANGGTYQDYLKALDAAGIPHK